MEFLTLDGGILYSLSNTNIAGLQVRRFQRDYCEHLHRHLPSLTLAPPSSSPHSHRVPHPCCLAVLLAPTILTAGPDCLASDAQGLSCLLLSSVAGPVSNLISCVVPLG